ncbi:MULTISPECIES: efflux RND transporter periplasmic adaptor subunit [Rhizobium]|uniref:Efflux RND transporter periplasmic adaptor subunit n=1 Tax=Rhizobium tropici TaxID=398 RepID=A0A6P1CC15_RHITR|nr:MULTISPECIES: efflux RND transporter periplasmic adaptor subunit [Rhizobium]AGB72558.1 resistance nodulation cell division (RND) drug efflux pump, MFP component [Rhizobium tropici CIAT 899]MBB4244757.1 RND family efflux transporter MFP subunit [Rhizobium tropici]MBB5596144.1 RND family efflux transporter MFP subunit [Rhizobium tropici]MBB6495112.1 RND family efflux transporter MFP subunit [Rhizobium tropici]NEV13672.1 efflux RND transporter periplasmic adaptor subunit [Rhizobium tropici]
MVSLTTNTLRTIAGAALFAAFGLGLTGCNEKKEETAEVVRPVKVVEIAQADTTRKLDYSGAVRARTDMNLGFRVNGKIVERKVDIGQRVKPGDVIARMDATDYILAVRRSQADLDAAEKQVQTTELARTRAQTLFSKNVTSKSQLEQAELSYEQAVSTRDSAVSALTEAKNQVAYADLTSDMNGIVTAINADVGQVVSSGTPVITVAVDGEKEVQVAVPEMDIAQFKVGKDVKARFWSDAALVLNGKVREVSGSADQSRTFAVRVSVPNDPRVLLGMTATIEALADNTQSYVSIPLSALAQKDGKQIVWLVDRSAGTVHSRAIQVADFADDGVRVADGLKAGDVVVAAGTQFMTENMKVKLPAASAQQASAEINAASADIVR